MAAASVDEPGRGLTLPPASHSPATLSLPRALLAGAIAGLATDAILFPLDTLKTRLQAPSGFWAAGGFQGIYRGLGSVAIGGGPSGALFFVAYESLRREHGVVAAACAGEVLACSIRVPVEVIKQRAQASRRPSAHVFSAILGGGGRPLRELYTGSVATLLRELPFTAVQFPLWETLKGRIVQWRTAGSAGIVARPATTAESALAGCVSGGFAALLTTPLDVIKTNIMLEQPAQAPGQPKPAPLSMAAAARRILAARGPAGFFAGAAPRVGWIGAGGAVFLGSYQWAGGMIGAALGE